DVLVLVADDEEADVLAEGASKCLEPHRGLRRPALPLHEVAIEAGEDRHVLRRARANASAVLLCLLELAAKLLALAAAEDVGVALAADREPERVRVRAVELLHRSIADAFERALDIGRGVLRPVRHDRRTRDAADARGVSERARHLADALRIVADGTALHLRDRRAEDARVRLEN